MSNTNNVIDLTNLYLDISDVYAGVIKSIEITMDSEVLSSLTNKKPNFYENFSTLEEDNKAIDDFLSSIEDTRSCEIDR